MLFNDKWTDSPISQIPTTELRNIIRSGVERGVWRVIVFIFILQFLFVVGLLILGAALISWPDSESIAEESAADIAALVLEEYAVFDYRYADGEEVIAGWFDYDCDDLEAYQKPVEVLTDDPWGLDWNGDGVACW